MLKHLVIATLALATYSARAQEANVRIGIARGIGTATGPATRNSRTRFCGTPQFAASIVHALTV